jgi:hypothetical protein
METYFAERGHGARLSAEARALNEAHQALREQRARRREYRRGVMHTAAIALAFVAVCFAVRAVMGVAL